MMNLILDIDYITRAGQKVRYVGRSGGNNDVPQHYCFRQSDEHIFCVLANGMFWGENGAETNLDIMGEWENDSLNAKLLH